MDLFLKQSRTLLTGIIALIIFVIPGLVHAGTETQNVKMHSIANNTSISITDNKGNSTSGFIIANRTASSILSINPYFLSQIAANVKIDLNVNYTTYSSGGVPSVTNITTSIEYSTSTKYKDKDIILFGNTYQLDAAIVSISVNGKNVTNLTAYPYVEFILEIQTERYYNFTGFEQINEQYIFSSYIEKSDEFEIVWGFVPGAEEYDLEWTYINDYSSEGITIPIPANDLSYNFKNNCTRILTSQNFYRISDIFERGYIILRIRPIGRFAENYKIPKPGRWSLPDNQLVSDVPGYQRIYIPGSGASWTNHEPSLNWQYSASFTEGGKKKEIVSYFDGSQHNRQTVTRATTANPVAIVAETIYDFQGRPAIQVLPAPAISIDSDPLFMSEEIKYYPDFNRNDEGNQYSWIDFDEDESNICSPNSTEIMSFENGSSYYYSLNLLDLNIDYQNFIPDADQIPFAQTEYMPDNTGRVRNQSGVGPNLALGGNHDTRYLYSSPSQEELNSFFGTEIGYAQYYQKNMIIDPNGQINISYVDPKGNQIISGLSGNGSTNLDPLPSLGEIEDRTQTFINTITDNNNSNTLSGGNLKSTPSITVTSADEQNFSYKLQPADFADNCMADAEICFDCIYDLFLKLQSICGEEIWNYSENGVSSNLNYDCDISQEINISEDIVAGTFEPGAYDLIKELKINEQALNDYLNLYLDPDINPCVPDLDDMIDDYQAQVDDSSCNYDCASCELSLGATWEEHQNIFGENAYSTIEEYNNALFECEQELCQTSIPYSISVLDQLMADVSPGGQYAEYMDEEGGFDPSVFDLSIFNDNCALPDRSGGENIPLWRKPFYNDDLCDYKDINNNISYILVEPVEGEDAYLPPILSDAELVTVTPDGNGGYYPDEDGLLLAVKPIELLGVEDFIEHFDYKSWPRFLVIYHPEYYYYQWNAEDKNDNTVTINNIQYNSDSYDEFINSLDYTDAIYINENLNFFNDFSLNVAVLNNDPFFAPGGAGSSYKSAVQNLMSIYPHSESYNIFEVAAYAYQYGTQYYNPIPSVINLEYATPEIKEKAWQLFKSLYLGLKKKYVYQVSNNYNLVSPNYGYNGCIENESFNPAEYGFNNGGYLNCEQPCCKSNYLKYMDKVKRFPEPDDIIGFSIDSPSEFITQKFKEKAGQLFKQQCPIEIELQSLLTALARDGELSSHEVPLVNYPEFSFNMYNLYNGSKNGFQPFTWHFDENTSTASTLSADIYSNNIVRDEIILYYPLAGSFNFDEIILFYDLKEIYDNNPLYNFRVSVIIEDQHNNRYKKFLYGFSGLLRPDIGINCGYEGETRPSCFASSFMDLMNELIPNGNLLSVSGISVNDFIPSCIKANNSEINFFWRYVAANNSFELYDNEINSTKIVLTSDDENFDFSTVSINYFSDITAGTRMYLEGEITITIDSILLFAHCSNDEVKLVNLYIDQVAIEKMNVSLTCAKYNNLLTLFLSDFESEMFGINNEPITISDYSALEFINQFYPIGKKTFQWDVEIQTLDRFKGNFYVEDDPIPIGFIEFSVIEKNDPFYPVDFTEIVCATFPVFDEPIGYTNEFYINSYNLEEGLNIALKGISSFQFSEACSPGGAFYSYRDCSAEYNELKGVFISQTVDNHLVYIGSEEDFCENEYFLYTNDIYSSNSPQPGIYLKYLSQVGVDFYGNANYMYNLANPLDCPFFISLEDFALLERLDGKDPGANWIVMYTLQVGDLENYFQFLLDAESLYESSGGVDGQFPYSDYFINISDFFTYYYNCYINFYQYLIDYGTYTLPLTEFANDHYCQKSVYKPLQRGVPKYVQKTISPIFPYENDCVENLLNDAAYNATLNYQYIIDSLTKAFIENYTSSCLLNAKELLQRTYKDQEHHFTMYFYDQSNNLVRTLPANGAEPNWDTEWSDEINTAREEKSGILFPETHDMKFASCYGYNSLNQLVWQKTPDAGESQFWYDDLGRLRFSQNAKQVHDETFSYTKYDELGRIYEVGLSNQKIDGVLVPLANAYANKMDIPEAKFNTEITLTNYDYPLTNVFYPDQQENVRARVAAVGLDNNGDGEYESTTFYSYDILGNVKSMVHQIPELVQQDIKRIDYTYDLVSGNVNKVSYQKGKYDQFFHKYEYDGENRLIHAYTSDNGISWDKDASYFYYLHGPLARAEIGDKKVQGIDYAYTLQGWLKGVNSNTLVTSRDQGRDGFYNNGSSPNNYFAKDSYGFSLNYFRDDYTSIQSTEFLASNSQSPKELYNGNISDMIATIMTFDQISTPVVKAVLNHYSYDQLNRITKDELVLSNASVMTNNSWAYASNSDHAYNTEYSYDANGNILSLKRNGKPGLTGMDDLNYNYYEQSNQLNYVIDDASATNYTDDIKTQATGNYQYDATGNLIQDISAEISDIKWNVYGKIKEISYLDDRKLSFNYGPDGNRLIKIYHANHADQKTYYIRDAQGNIMATYDQSTTQPLTLAEQNIYGSSRIGMIDKSGLRLTGDLVLINDGINFDSREAASQNMLTGTVDDRSTPPDPGVSNYTKVAHTTGLRHYELTDHLGNVLTTISDRKKRLAGTTPAFEAVIETAQDYYPFGSLMPGRKYNAGEYRFGFNGQEKDDEIAGVTGSHYTTQFREYDSRLSRWWSNDPIFKPHESPFALNGNNPIWIIDPSGSDSIFYNQKGDELADLRINCKEDFFFLEHDKGNREIGGQNYYEGLSRESFFGDRGDGEQLFNEVDERFNQNHEWKFYAIARDHKNNEHTVGDFIKESPENMHYDFKNTFLNKSDNPHKAYIVEGMLLNANEVGNILWGATAASFGFTSFWAQTGAYVFTLKDEGKPDEAGEQRAIEIGVYIWNKYNPNKK
jgi:RHS repeat-associated protein